MDFHLSNDPIMVIQGEGPLMGKKFILLRFKGCNLHCKDCDEPDSLTIKDDDKKYDVEKIVSYIKDYYDKFGINNLMITGGEPLLYQEQIYELLKLCHEKKIKFDHINIETNGSIMPVYNYFKDENMLLSISPKIGALKSNTDISEEVFFSVIEKLYFQMHGKYNFIIKLVIDPDDLSLLDKIDSMDDEENKPGILILHKLKYDKKIYLMPLGKNRNEQIERSQKLIDICITKNYEFSPRLHILIYDEKKNV